MNQADWDAVDSYFSVRLAADEKLEDVLAANEAADLPAIDVSALQGKFLMLMVRAIGARRVLEIGTLGGYSTIWMALGLDEGGTVVSIEYQPHHAEVARANAARAGVADKVDIRVGRALDLLPEIEAAGGAPFDLVFIDADKNNQDAYTAWALKLARRGAVIIGDNVVRDGEVIDAATKDPLVQGVQRSIDLLAAEPRLTATAIQTVGSKGWDGFAFAVVD